MAFNRILRKIRYTYLNVLGEGNYVFFIQIPDTLHIYLGRITVLDRLTVWAQVLAIKCGLLFQTFKQCPLHSWFRDQCSQCFTIRVENIGNESRGVLNKLGLGDKFA